MVDQLKSHLSHHSPATEKRRSAWRQKLVEAERGLTLGFRGDSSFFVHFFTGTIVLTAGLVLQIELIHWTILVLAFTMVLASEMFYSVLKTILFNIGHHLPEQMRRAIHLGTAAVLVTYFGAVLTIGLIFGRRLFQIFSG